MDPKLYLKAIFGAIATGLGIAYVALNDGVISLQEWVQIAEGMVLAGATVYQIPNLPPVPAQKVNVPPTV